MGLTISYALHAPVRDAKDALKTVEQLRRRALDLPFQEVGEIIEASGPECDFKNRDRDDSIAWLLCQSGRYLADGQRHYPVCPSQLVAFSTWPGEGCEAANFGLAVYPKSIQVQDSAGRKKSLDTGLKPWSWESFCKTQYASDPGCGGIDNFLKCHLAIIHLLDHAKLLGILEKVSDEGLYWEKRDVRALAEVVGNWNRVVAGVVGKIKDMLNGELEAAILKFQNFEHLEAEGRKNEK